MITKDILHELFHQCVEQASSLYPQAQWRHRLQRIEWDTYKTSYGRVTTTGIIKINPAFIGTNTEKKLKETIFHEIAHLIVGLDQHHNTLFKRVEQRLIQGIWKNQRERHDQRKQVHQNNGYKYELIAYSQTRQYCCGHFFRRHKKYTHYKPSQQQFMSIGNDKILFFRYRNLL